MNIKLAVVFLSALSCNFAVGESNESSMKILTCESGKSISTGKTYKKWQAVFDANKFSQGKLEYELTEWYSEESPKNGEKFVFPMKVTPTEIIFYHSITIRGKINWFTTTVDRETLSYGGKHSPSTETGTCEIEAYKNKI